MIYLIEPTPTMEKRCPAKCFIKCATVCGIKPMYGVVI